MNPTAIRLASRALVVVLAAVLSSVTVAAAGVPSDQLRAQVDRVLKILQDPDLLKDNRAAERRLAIRKVANDIFDFEEISRRALARHWAARTPAEQQEFMGLMGTLLEDAYLSKIETYSGEKIQFLGDSAEGDLATVRTKIVTKQGTEIPVDYRMLGRGGRWLAYDVSVEGVSLVGNYRTQFDRFIQKQSYPELVKTLKAKQAERKDKDVVETRRKERLAEASAPKSATPPPRTERPQSP
jgi:phospholipid transport system substrate-binding protein